MGKGKRRKRKASAQAKPQATPAATEAAPASVPAGAQLSPRALTALVFCLFFGSGAVGLMYEMSWVKAITLVFGSTTLAVSTVVSIYMGGLALGAGLAGRRADRLPNPLTWYGALEAGLALYALATPLLFGSLLPWLGSLAGAGGTWTLSLLRFLASSLLLLPPTLLMGATLPVLSRFYARQRGEGGRGAGLLYGVNTVGAFGGTLAAGFWLLPGLGVQNTVLLVAGLNLLLGLSALLLGRRHEPRVAAAAPAEAEAEAEAPPASGLPPRRLGGVLGAVALTGFAALVCEVTWTRILAMELGASVYAFTIVLGTFLAALGLGAAGTAAFLRGSPRRAATVFYVLALASAVAVCASFGVAGKLPAWFLDLYWSWGFKDDPDMVLRAQMWLAAAVVWVPTLIMGGLFSAALRITVSEPTQTARAVSWLYLSNTLGSVLGSFTAGFFLVPLLGMRGALVVAMLGQCAGAALLILLPGSGRGSRVGCGAALGLGALLVALTPGWAPQLMTSGMFQYARGYRASTAAQLREALHQRNKLLFYEDGLTATVTVLEDLSTPRRDLWITTNGKIDGSSHADMPTQRLAAHLPLLLHPDPHSACIIGLGTGCTLASARRHQLDDLTCVEIEQAMVDGAHLFGPYNDHVLDDPSTDVRVTDGRLFLQLHPAHYDVLISEPSNPWLAGVSHLFTQEYYRLGKRALRPGGVFAQWIQLYGLAPENVRILLRTFHSVFPQVYVFSTLRGTDLLLLGAEAPLDFDLRRLEQRMSVEAIAADLGDPSVHIRSPLELLSRFRLGPQELDALVGEGPLHTDDLPVLSYRAPRDLYSQTRERNAATLEQHARGAIPYLHGLPEDPQARDWALLRYVVFTRRFLATPASEERAAEARIAGEGQPSRFPRELDFEASKQNSREGIKLAQAGQPARAIPFFRQALTQDPCNAAAWGNLSRAQLVQGRAQEALESAQRALDVNPRYALGFWHRGEALEALERPHEALADYQRALALDPELAGLKEKIASLQDSSADGG